MVHIIHQHDTGCVEEKEIFTQFPIKSTVVIQLLFSWNPYVRM